MSELDLQLQIELGESWVGLDYCHISSSSLAVANVPSPATPSNTGGAYDQRQIGKHWYGSFAGYLTGSTDRPLDNDWGVLQIDETPGNPRTAVAEFSGLQIYGTHQKSGNIYLTGRFDFVGYVTKGVRLDLTANATLTISDADKYITNYGATGTITADLPAAPAAGMTFSACVVAGHELRLNPGDNDNITVRSAAGAAATGGDGKYIGASVQGSRITLVADASGNWVYTDQAKVWTPET